MRVLLVVLAIALAWAEPLEFYTFDGRLADPCVNRERLDGLVGKSDCTRPTMPASGNFVEVPDTATLVNLQAVSVTGRFFPGAGNNGFFGFPNPTGATGPDCGTFNGLAPDIPLQPLGGTTTAINFGNAAALTNLLNNWITPGVPVAAAVSAATPAWTESTYPAADATKGINEATPRKVCWASAAAGPWQWTGFYIGVVFSCEQPGTNIPTRLCSNRPYPPRINPVTAATTTADAVIDMNKAVFRSQTTCCPASAQQALRASQCINPNVQSCCGASAVALNSQKCCNGTTETVAWVDGTCPCTRATGVNACQFGDQCCLPTKYNELIPTTLPIPDLNLFGECYNPRYYRCCDTGNKYDPGTDQCCSINGLQSVNTPCPCGADADCVGGQLNYIFTDFKCCQQTAPATGLWKNTCGKYQNYPSGTGLAAAQQCAGRCYDTKYQICCNGRACLGNYERCCNATCCNRYNGTCMSGTLKTGTSRNNYIEVNVVYDACTTVEQINLIRAWWMFVLPTFFLIVTLTGLAIALVFAGRVEHSARRGLEKGMILAALICVLFSCCLYFAPLYKYGIVITFFSLFAIITAAARQINMYIACIVLQVILIIYLIDPFHGNDYFNLAVDRNAAGRADPYSAGLWHSTTRMWDQPSSCWDFYTGYFQFDPTIRDTFRIDESNNPSFGYCSRGWVSALLVFDGFIIIAVIAQIVLDVIVLLVRGRMIIKASNKWIQ